MNENRSRNDDWRWLISKPLEWAVNEYIVFRWGEIRTFNIVKIALEKGFRGNSGNDERSFVEHLVHKILRPDAPRPACETLVILFKSRNPYDFQSNFFLMIFREAFEVMNCFSNVTNVVLTCIYLYLDLNQDP